MEEKYRSAVDRRVDETLEQYDRRLINHSRRIGEMEKVTSSLVTEVKNLVIQLTSLNGNFTKFMILFMTTLLGFFIYAIQKGLF